MSPKFRPPRKVVTDNPEVLGRTLTKFIGEVQKFAALELHTRLTAPPSQGGTPFKSGYARASWILSVGSPSKETGGSKGNPNRGPSDAGIAAVDAYTYHPGGIYITNNAAHINRLNYGWSKQAQPGFVERAEAETMNEVEKVCGGNQ